MDLKTQMMIRQQRAADRLHPESIRTLRQLVKLHGTTRLIKEIWCIDEEETRMNEEIKQINDAAIAKARGEA